ncbi:MAG: translation initiation factor IF-1 [Candidatus Tagabacteria bacterium CG09_land_8_20_14_0_10_41_14]|uniref:Translation initiation factor IF-1 n=2 Tax=Candidatus Tagaibacteriota TaxID=1817918 RepID=A0A2H0WL16_9BACT|nr:MAG: translation initiation factor IF-1 [Candidatus Tagabacteria bacterium CG09_land_8_20_14_0_10_41_14]PJE72939.1 MAG: translation initiation factor IF-1 [Candidatus Tagabacteria bacterium CG10_big_fil_rev_8_21_14_0_10_40_13]
MVKENNDAVDGQVIEALPNTTFRVKIKERGEAILAHLSGKMRMYRIKVVVGDKVKVELDSYGKRGRIVKRE